MANEAYDEACEGKKSYEKLLTQKQVNVDLYYRLGLKVQAGAESGPKRSATETA